MPAPNAEGVSQSKRYDIFGRPDVNGAATVSASKLLHWRIMMRRESALLKLSRGERDNEDGFRCRWCLLCATNPERALPIDGLIDASSPEPRCRICIH